MRQLPSFISNKAPSTIEITLTIARRYVIIDPKQLYLSYAAAMTETSAVHVALKNTSTGDPLQLVERGKWIHLETIQGIPIAALSEAGRKEWGPRLGKVRSATVIAMVRRTIEQQDVQYRANCRSEAWEFPIVEVCWNGDPTR